MARTSFKSAITAVSTVLAAGAALLFTAGPAAAENPPYDGCPSWALCVYQHGGGLGSKAIIVPPAAGGHGSIARLTQIKFLNGESADNQVSSWINNSQCQAKFMDDPYGELHPSDLDFTSMWDWGAKGDYGAGSTKYYVNDRISSIQFWCP
ncbi:peptidase inhibitor family I36 [Streptomyces sp. PanSC19]|uniref:peptidase inhibitor family I36 protein n=1 Tax=Streptomyces sp. PanSC19 TaxID=1520455 RepID=UPI000FB3E519|nr:peptidase inhibitor family I36 protein [Streptomyces sp. PanSC19]ROQ26494.1 peptidase inhibitor family I36 [Streptomyces sp. PanSC19]